MLIKLAKLNDTNNLVNQAIASSRLLPSTKAIAPVATSMVQPLSAVKRFGSVVGKVAKTAVKAF
jgi:hypothetical protein